MRLWRYCFAGLLFNWLGFVFWTVVPIVAEKYHPSATQLALLQTSSSVVYVLTSLISGGLSDRVSRSALARLGVLLGMAACAAVVYINNLSLLYLAAPLMGLGGSIFWPSIQGAVGAESEPARVERSIGWFNVSWSVGKTLGFVIAGWLAQRHGHGFVLWIAVAAAAPILFLYPGDRKLHAPEGLEPGRSDTAVFRTMGYIANFMAFGAGNVFSNQFYKYAEKMKLGGGHPETL